MCQLFVLHKSCIFCVFHVCYCLVILSRWSKSCPAGCPRFCHKLGHHNTKFGAGGSLALNRFDTLQALTLHMCLILSCCSIIHFVSVVLMSGPTVQVWFVDIVVQWSFLTETGLWVQFLEFTCGFFPDCPASSHNPKCAGHSNAAFPQALLGSAWLCPV